MRSRSPRLSCVAALAVAAVACPLALASAATGLEPAIGNVIVSTHPDGRQAKLWLKRDQTYRAEGRRGEMSGGVWKVKGGKLCLSQKTPHPGLFTYCRRYPDVRLGQKWSDKAFNGEPVTNQVVAGGQPR